MTFGTLPMRILTIAVLLSLCWYLGAVCGQHVVIVVIDGARYSETFGSGAKYIPRMWNDLRKEGAIYTSFWNDGMTKTCPGHASILTGVWQTIPNDGSVRPSAPTLFERLRKQRPSDEHSCYVVSGKPKLDCLTYSTAADYGTDYGASFVCDKKGTDTGTYRQLEAIMDRFHPSLVMVNLPRVDLSGHAGRWDDYVSAIRGADSLVEVLWLKIQSDSIYANTTTLFVTNDHGRHDPEHGGFKDHGDTCDGCRHIMLFALGPNIQPNASFDERCTQIDIAPTIAGILGIAFPPGRGRALRMSAEEGPEK